MCSLDGGAYAACSSPKTYPGLSQGQHTFQVKVTDPAGNQSGASSPYTFFVDTVKPNTPNLTVKPTDPSPSTTAHFEWTDTDPGAPTTGTGIAAYFCSKENGPYQLCGGGNSGSITFTVSGPNNSQHQFAIYAVDWAGNISDITTYKWKVGTGQVQPLVISGNGATTVYPGGSAALVPVKFTNPNVTAVSVTGFTISISAPSGCTAGDFLPVNYGATPISAGNPLNVPANGSVTLPAGGVSEPSIQMANSASSQDTCKGATITLNYTSTGGTGSGSGSVTVGTAAAFTIAGNAHSLLYPGAASTPIDITITNNNSFAIYVTSLTVTVTNDPNGCTNATNIVVTPSSASAGTPIMVPANASGYVVPAAFQPKIKLKETGVPQNQCKNQTFTLSYSGSAHS
jgi:hypothetical protein